MSSPIRYTLSSRSMSSISASWSAVEYSISATSADLQFACIDELVEVLEVGVRALVGVVDHLLHLALDIVLDLLEVVRRGELGGDQLRLEKRQRVGLEVLLLLLLVAVLVGVDDGVALEAVGDRLDEARLRILARL